MRRLAGILALAGATVAVPSLAAEGGHQDVTLWKWLNFAALVGVLGYFGYKKAGAYFRSRTEEIQTAIAESARLKREAEGRLATAEARLLSLTAEVEELRRTSRAEMEFERERVRLETEQEARKIQALAEQEIASAAKTARQQLKAHSAELVMGLAEQKIRSGLTPQGNDALVDSFLADLDERSSSSQPDREAG